NERRDQAAGRARVAQGTLDMTDISIKEEEQQALAEQALTEFTSAYGLEMPPPAATATPTSPAPATPAPAKEMGPTSS
ncbi:MAG TPA: hypothetical protein VKK81_09225, partial [Candidatus Binatia bacterium]|nr:hypothetical protein [Candidatus Binatia bacterium]